MLIPFWWNAFRTVVFVMWNMRQLLRNVGERGVMSLRFAVTAGCGSRCCIRREMSMRKSFTRIQRICMKKHENCLFRSLGKDYMKYPLEEERKSRRNGIFDPEKSYTKYVSLLYDIFRDCRGNEIILFGAA